MIRYDLRCDAGHAFDTWFRNGDEFDRLAKRKAVACPHCGSTAVAKAIMAPAIRSGRGGSSAAPAGDEPAAQPTPAPAEPDDKVRLAAPDPRQAALVEALRQVHRHVRENSEYVGERFAEEARKVHYGEAAPRGIYGEATPEEARALAEEGVTFSPLPPLPEERN